MQYKAPTNVIAGHGTLASLPQMVIGLGCRRAMIVTDAGVRQAGLAQLVEDALCDFYVGIFDDIPSDGDLTTVDAATAKGGPSARTASSVSAAAASSTLQRRCASS